MKTIRILLVGGGTGGHIYPLIAVARRIQEMVAPTGADLDIRYFGSPGIFRDELNRADIRIERIIPSKLRRYFDIQNMFDIFRFLLGLMQAFVKLYVFMPDVAFSKGGPGALAVTLMCRFYRIPLVVHESDVVPGITNRISARGARLLALGFPNAEVRIPRIRGEVRIVGNPVRSVLLGDETPETAKSLLNFDPTEPLIFVWGGSQGAEALNAFVFQNIEALCSEFQVFHQVGKDRYETYKNEFAFISKAFPEALLRRYRFVPYLEEELGYALRAADIVVSRAGASAITEIAATGRPSILVPLPGSANDHQRENAYAYAESGAAIVLTEENLLINLFLEAVGGLLGDEKKRAAMSAAARAFFIPDADRTLATELLHIAHAPQIP